MFPDDLPLLVPSAALDPGAVHVAWVRLEVPASPARAASLDAAERTRAARFHHERDRRRFVAARAALRAVLGGVLGCAPADVRLVEGPYGKPALHPLHASALRFNLSHSADRAVLALAHGRELGVDVEAERVEVDVLEVARQAFSPEEAHALAALPEASHRACFFRTWARKEAVIKAAGTGFAVPSDTFTLTLGPEAPRLLEHRADPGAVERWALCDLAAPEGFAAALAVERPAPERLVCWQLSGE